MYIIYTVYIIQYIIYCMYIYIYSCLVLYDNTAIKNETLKACTVQYGMKAMAPDMSGAFSVLPAHEIVLYCIVQNSATFIVFIDTVKAGKFASKI